MTTSTRCLLLVALASLAASQYLGTNYQTGDASRQESVDADGTVQGQYSYVDPTGQAVSVRYTAGQDGFQVVPQEARYPVPQEYQPRFTQALFTPADQPYPAHTAGQVKTLQDYLLEERMDLEKERQMATRQAQSHVSVQGPTQGYSYNIKY